MMQSQRFEAPLKAYTTLASHSTPIFPLSTPQDPFFSDSTALLHKVALMQLQQSRWEHSSGKRRLRTTLQLISRISQHGKEPSLRWTETHTANGSFCSLPDVFKSSDKNKAESRTSPLLSSTRLLHVVSVANKLKLEMTTTLKAGPEHDQKSKIISNGLKITTMCGSSGSGLWCR